MTVRNREEIVMTAIEQRHHRPDCHDVEVADDRAATLAALSGELTQRLSKHPPPPRRHVPERKRSPWQPMWRTGLLSALVVAVAGLTTTSSWMIRKELERFRGEPADTSPVASSIMTVSTAAATAPPPQSAAPPIDPPTVASAPAHDGTIAASPGDLRRVDDRELNWTEVHELQIRLRALKFDPGPLDGVKGPLTSAAVRRFQESQGDRATGDIGLRTLLRLRQATAAPE
jgi:hypothetical protein